MSSEQFVSKDSTHRLKKINIRVTPRMKKIKTLSHDRSSYSPGRLDILCLTKDSILAISAYLPKTSQVLFAVALTASTKSWGEKGYKGRPSKLSQSLIELWKAPCRYRITGHVASARLERRHTQTHTHTHTHTACLDG